MYVVVGCSYLSYRQFRTTSDALVVNAGVLTLLENRLSILHFNEFSESVSFEGKVRYSLFFLEFSSSYYLNLIFFILSFSVIAAILLKNAGKV